MYTVRWIQHDLLSFEEIVLPDKYHKMEREAKILVKCTISIMNDSYSNTTILLHLHVTTFTQVRSVAEEQHILYNLFTFYFSCLPFFFGDYLEVCYV